MKNLENSPGGCLPDNEKIVIYSSGKMRTVTVVFVRNPETGEKLPTLLTGDAREDVSTLEPTDN